MKKAGFYLVLYVVFSLFSSCQKLSFQEDLDYTSNSELIKAQSNLMATAKKFAYQSNNALLKSKVYQGVSKQFDGDNDLLLCQLDSSLELVGSSLNDLIVTNLKNSDSNLNMVLNDENGNNYYPQIFIPFYEELENKNLLGKKEPVIIPFTVESEDDTYTGFRFIAETGELEEIIVDEEFARKNEVWVISINERVNNEGNLVAKSTYNKKGTNSALTTINVKIDKMTVYDLKESWISGKAEVSIRANLEYYDGGLPGPLPSFRFTQDLVGIDIRQFTKDEVNNETEIKLDFRLENDWTVTNFYDDAIIYLYVIFEADGWPNPVQTDQVTFNNGLVSRNVEYRSSQDSYSSGVIYGNTNGSVYSNLYAGGYSISNAEIKFNTVVF